MNPKDELYKYLNEHAEHLRATDATKRQEAEAAATAEQKKQDDFTAYLNSKLEGETE